MNCKQCEYSFDTGRQMTPDNGETMIDVFCCSFNPPTTMWWTSEVFSYKYLTSEYPPIPDRVCGRFKERK